MATEEIPAWAVDLTKTLSDGLKEMSADVRLVSSDLGVLKDRVTVIEQRTNDQEAWSHNTVDAMRRAAELDAAHEKRLSEEKAAREALAEQVAKLAATNETQLAILSRLDRLAANPSVKIIGGMLLTAIISWLASKGLVIK